MDCVHLSADEGKGRNVLGERKSDDRRAVEEYFEKVPIARAERRNEVIKDSRLLRSQKKSKDIRTK
ncbi:hypothetical protein BJX76DRAFT_130110 [Aspergillus varians]